MDVTELAQATFNGTHISMCIAQIIAAMAMVVGKSMCASLGQCLVARFIVLVLESCFYNTLGHAKFERVDLNMRFKSIYLWLLYSFIVVTTLPFDVEFMRSK